VTSDLIYHYTDLTGLIGIIETRCIWATDVRFLNDFTESPHGWVRMKELVQVDLASRPQTPSLVRFQQAWFDLVPKGRVYIGCFCAKPNLLSQWRGYGQQGYSMGFERAVLTQIGAGSPVFTVRDIEYAEDVQRATVKRIVDGCLNQMPTNDVEPPLFALTTASDLLSLGPNYKHPDFEEEQEVRAEHWHGDDSKVKLWFRQTPYGPTPYVKLPTDITTKETALRHIVVGPAPHQRTALYGVRELLQAHDYFDVTSELSMTPLRYVARQ
jgi:hypothetical protein